jgi:single-strand DNA-binding protein
MSSMNRVFLAGNLTRKPELRTTPGGAVVSDLGLAVTDRYRNKAGEAVEATCFTDVVVWGRQAEACGRFLDKGAPVLVEGRLQYDQWETEGGEKRSRLRVRADRIQFLARRPGAEGPATVEGEDPESAVPVAGARPASGTAKEGTGDFPF